MGVSQALVADKNSGQPAWAMGGMCHVCVRGGGEGRAFN